MLYEIRVRGQLDSRWSDWFDGLMITAGAHGEAILTGSIADQPALHGLLAKIRDLGLPLVAVNRIKTDPAFEQDAESSGPPTVSQPAVVRLPPAP